MKRKTAVAAVLVAFICALAFSGCADNKVYYTVAETPDHVKSVSVLADGNIDSDTKGYYVKKGSAIDVLVNLEAGYNLGTLKVFANGEELIMIPDNGSPDNTLYKTKKTYPIGEKLNITFSGAPAIIVNTASVV